LLRLSYCGKTGQIHHIDDDPSNNEESNLSVLCLVCHRETQIRGGFDRKLDASQIILYRDNWLQLVAKRRAESSSAVSPNTAAGDESTSTAITHKSGEYLFYADGPAIVWQLPRGVVALTLVLQHDQETVVADYCSYNGSWLGSTHYHPAYRDFWWGTRARIDTQYRKLQIERGDWDYARKALELMTEIAEGRLVVDAAGKLYGERSTEFSESDLMKIFVNEEVPFAHVPEKYFRLSLSGGLRDLEKRLEEICEVFSMRYPDTEQLADARTALKSVRREVRIEAHKVLGKEDPALLNLLELILSFNASLDLNENLSWARDLISALNDAIRQIHNTRQ
jgi:hypothetical protein